MGSSKKHKEKHHKKEKKRRRSRSRSAERRRNPSRSRSRSPIENSYSLSDNYTAKNNDRSEADLRYRGARGHAGQPLGASSSSTNIDTAYGNSSSEFLSRTKDDDVKVKVEPGWEGHYGGDIRTIDYGHGMSHESSISRHVKRESDYLQTETSNSRASSQRDLDDRSRDRDYQDEVERLHRAKQRERKREQHRRLLEEEGVVESTPQPPSSSGGDMALSIEETNKLRAQLGLKPLDIGTSGDQGPPQEKSYEDRDDVHQPAINLAEQRKASKMKEKLEEIREKRKMQKKLQKVKGIGVASDDDPVIESASAWVSKSRQREQEKLMAQKRAKLLEEMDGEFGISSIADQVLGRKEKKKSYTSRDLKGLRVEHAASEFTDERALILTLKDKGVLDEEDDVLENVNLVDDRKTQKNVENKKKNPDYRPYDEPDEDGVFKSKEILDKYDQVIDGEQTKSFRLDAFGRGDDDDERELERIRENLRQQQESLQTSQHQVALDYYTSEEMVKFNRPKKRRKVRKREIVKADDLIPMGETVGQDHGSRNPKTSRSRPQRAFEDQQEPVNMDISDEESENMRDENDAFDVDDEAELELQLALERSRKTKLKDKNSAVGAEKVAQVVLATSNKEERGASVSDKKSKGTIVLDSTSEFCRTLGEVPTSGQEKPVKEEQEDEDMMYAGQEYDVKAGGWSRVYETKSRTNEEPEMDENVLDAEPIASHGVASALSLATMKGYLEAEKKKEVKKANLNFPETKAYIDEEKMRDDDRDRHHRYDPYGFQEKEGYKPDIKLEYVDESGRMLTPKEAFRYLSHKFHGKGSGKMKTEKRAKKQSEEAKLEQMSAIDTPLGTVKMMSERQKQASTPYVVLSGGGKNLLSSETISKK